MRSSVRLVSLIIETMKQRDRQHAVALWLGLTIT